MVIIVVNLVMGIHSKYDYQLTKKEIIEEIEEDAARSLIALDKNIANFMAAYSINEYEQLVKAEAERYRHTLAIIVDDYNMGKLLDKGVYTSGVIRNKDWTVTDYDPENQIQNKQLKEHFISIKREITSAVAEPLGSITLYTSQRFLQLKLEQLVEDKMTQTLVINLFLISLLVIVLRVTIIRPISRIVKTLNECDEGGIPLSKLPHNNLRELSVLSDTLNSMIDMATTSRISLLQKNEELQLSARVFLETHDGIMITDADKNIVDVNRSFCKITGYSKGEVLGKNPSILSSGIQSVEYYKQLWAAIGASGYWQGEIWNRKHNGESYAELLTISELKDEQGNTTNYIGVFTDITHSKHQQKKLQKMAHYDVLTGLPNRTLLIERFRQEVTQSKRSNLLLAVCFLDLDSFKPINDTYGHEVGDKLLVQVSKRILGCIREVDTVSRQGGDEFVLLLNGLHSIDECELTLKRIHKELSRPFVIDKYSHSITASSGISFYSNDDCDLDILIRQADKAMYQAKLKGKNRYHFFDPEHDQETIKKHLLLDEISKALVSNEFQLFYQPKLNMRTGQIFGAEALIRWVHPEKGIIPPLDFLPMVEGTELEIFIGDWVIATALQQLDDWQQQGIQLEVSVNIASFHLQSESFLDSLETTIKQYPRVNPSYLQLEILESSVLADLDAINNIIDACQTKLGVKFALDDFGTGFSSLTHLRRLPVDIIKMDQSFAFDLLDDPADFVIVDGVIQLANQFDRSVIAEGVETLSQGLMLILLGCDCAQGYGIAKPMPASAIPEWLNSYEPYDQWLSVANSDRSVKTTKLKQLELLAIHWLEQIKLKINVQGFLIDGSLHSPFAALVKQIKQNHLLSTDSIFKLESNYQNIHNLQRALNQECVSGDGEKIQMELSKLEQGFTDMRTLLNQLN